MRKSMLAVASHANVVPSGSSLSEAHAISALSALAQPTRLAIFRLLVKHEPIGVTAGVIAETIGAPHNTLSTHLAILVRAGLLRSSREGRTIIYRSDVEGMRSVIAFLVDDCCDGHPELCNLVAADAVACCSPAPGEGRVAQIEEGCRQRQELIAEGDVSWTLWGLVVEAFAGFLGAHAAADAIPTGCCSCLRACPRGRYCRQRL